MHREKALVQNGRLYNDREGNEAEWYRDRFHGKVSPCDLAPHTEKAVGEGRVWCQQWNSMLSDKNTGLQGLYKICFCNKNVSKIMLFIVSTREIKWY